MIADVEKWNADRRDHQGGHVRVRDCQNDVPQGLQEEVALDLQCSSPPLPIRPTYTCTHIWEREKALIFLDFGADYLVQLRGDHVECTGGCEPAHHLVGHVIRDETQLEDGQEDLQEKCRDDW